MWNMNGRIWKYILLFVFCFFCIASSVLAQSSPQTSPNSPNSPTPTAPNSPIPSALPDSTSPAKLGRLIQVLHSDQGTISPTNKVLRGHVRLQQDQTYIEADEVTDEFAKAEIYLTGNVKIVKDNDILVAQKVVYNTTTKVATAVGNSLVSNAKTKVRAPSALYYTQEHRIVFNQGVNVQDSTLTITARSGEYFTNTKQGTFAGNVEVHDGKTVLSSNSATYNTDTKYGTFTGNVVIRDGKTILKSTTAEYSTQLRSGLFKEPMTIIDGKTTINAQRGEYNTRDGEGKFYDGVTLQDSTMTLKSKDGLYYRETQTSFFFGHVVLNHPDFYLEADTLTHFRQTEKTLAKGNVFIERIAKSDSTDRSRTFLFGRQLDHDNRQKITIMTGNPFAFQLKPKDNSESKSAKMDTLMIRAQRLESAGQEQVQTLKADHNVRLWRNNFAAKMDSLIYIKEKQAPDAPNSAQNKSTQNKSEQNKNVQPKSAQTPKEMLYLFKSPMAWVDNNQITGDTMQVRIRDGKTDSLLVRGNAFIAQFDSSLAKINQLKGQRIIGHFEKDSLRTLYVAPQAEALFFQKNDKGTLDKGVEMVANWILMSFRQGKLAEMNAYKPEGKIYDVDIFPDPFQLKGFNWLPEQRPKKPDFPLSPSMKQRIQMRLATPLK
jgi:lipopolysaccharide export system protein LptA